MKYKRCSSLVHKNGEHCESSLPALMLADTDWKIVKEKRKRKRSMKEWRAIFRQGGNSTKQLHTMQRWTLDLGASRN